MNPAASMNKLKQWAAKIMQVDVIRKYKASAKFDIFPTEKKNLKRHNKLAEATHERESTSMSDTRTTHSSMLPGHVSCKNL